MCQNNRIYYLIMKDLLDKYKKQMNENDLLFVLNEPNNINLKNAIEHIATTYDNDLEKIKRSEEYEKLKLLFFKTRFTQFPSIEVFKEITCELAEKFNLKTFQIFCGSHLFSDPKALLNMIQIFGLFEKDKDVNKRINKLVDIFFNQRIYCQRSEIGEMSEIAIVKNTLYLLDEKVRNFIPDELKPYLNDDITPEYYSFLRKIRGNFGKKLNDFLVPCYIDKKGELQYKKSVTQNEEYFNYIKSKTTNGVVYSPYTKDIDDYYAIRKEVPLSRKKELLEVFKEYELTYGPSDTLTMFVNVDSKFDLNFYDYFIRHQPDIVNSTNSFSKFSFVQKNFYDALKFYQEKGNNDPDYVTIIEWLRSTPYDVDFGYENFANIAKNAGILKEGYEYYLQLFQIVKKRYMRVLPNHHAFYKLCGKDGNEYLIETKILDGSDPMNMLIGESKYTDCCQKYDDIGRECLEHASTSLMGGILVVSLVVDGISRPLSQSWVWINEQELVFDNVEQVLFLKNSTEKQREIYEDLIADALRKTAQDIITNSNIELEKYIAYEIKKTDQLSDCLEKEKILLKLKEIKERQSIKVVSIGSAYSDIIVKNYFSKQAKRQLVLPKDYRQDGYTDAKVRYIAAGTEEDIKTEVSSNYVEIPIYRENRKIISTSMLDASNELIKKLNDIDNSMSMNCYEIMSKKDFIRLRNLNEHDFIICGDDWYCTYHLVENKINITRLSTGKPRLTDELNCQLSEIQSVFNNLFINKNKVLR